MFSRIEIGGNISGSRYSSHDRVREWINNLTLPGAALTKDPVKLKDRTKRRLLDLPPANETVKKARLADPVGPKAFYQTKCVKTINEENLKTSCTDAVKTPLKSNKSPSIINGPLTPESKRTRSAPMDSPGSSGWIDQMVNVSKRICLKSRAIRSDSESQQSTPKKESFHTLANGLDSPSNSSVPATPTPSTSKQSFSKLGNRLSGKSPLQYYRDQISKHNQLKTPRSNTLSKATPRRKSLSKASMCQSGISIHASNQAESAIVQSVEILPNQQSESPDTTMRRSPSSNKDKENKFHTIPIRQSKPKVKFADTRDRSDKLADSRDGSDEMDQRNTTLHDSLPVLKTRSANLNPEDDEEQLVLDVGQQELGAAHQCHVCMMIYSKSSPSDEALHKRFHSQLMSALKFTGWKRERVVEQGGEYRIISIEPGDPIHCINKLKSLKVILDQELGFVHEDNLLNNNRKIYLYIDGKHITGICVAENIIRAARYENGSVSESSFPALVGVNRIWVYAKSRRQRIATKLLDAVRSTFGMGMCIPLSHIAFSDPTTHGKRFASKYTQSDHFLVYRP